MANRNFNSNKLYQFESYGVLLSCNFVVDQTNGNGLGIRNLKGSGVRAVYMNTNPAATTTTAVFATGALTITVANLTNLVVGMVVTDSTTSGNLTSNTKITAINTVTNQITLNQVTAGASASAPGDTLSFAMTAALASNPNPAAGIITLQLTDTYNRLLGMQTSIISPLTGSNLTLSGGSVVANAPYVIVSLGTTTTAANWVTAGLPVGVTAVVGATFIATAAAHTGTGLGNAVVQAPSVSGIISFEGIGDANNMNAVNPAAPATQGMWITLQALGPTISTGAYVAPLIPTAPANNSVISMEIYLSNSSVQQNGQ